MPKFFQRDNVGKIFIARRLNGALHLQNAFNGSEVNAGIAKRHRIRIGHQPAVRSFRLEKDVDLRPWMPGVRKGKNLRSMFSRSSSTAISKSSVIRSTP